MTKARSIMLLGSLGLVVLIVAGWFLLLSPRLGTASDLNDQRTDVEAQNAITTSDIAELEQMKANIETAKAEADELTNRFPPTAEESELFALIKEAADRAGLSESKVSDLTAGIPAIGASDGSVTLPEAADPNAAPAAESTDPNAAPAAGTEAAPVVDTPVAQLGSMALDMTVSGTEVQIMRFLSALENMDRAYLVTSVTFGASEGEDGGTGEMSASITGTMYLLPELVLPVDESAAADEEATLPQ